MYPFSIRDLQTDAMFVPALQPSGPLIVSPVRQAVTEAGDRMLDDELIRVGALVAYAACRQMTPQYLQALHDSVEQACCLPSRFDWDRKAASHAEIVNLLADAAGDPALAVLVRDVPRQLHDLVIVVGPAASGIIASSRRRLLAVLRAGDAAGAAREMEQHLRGLLWMRRVFCRPVSGTAQGDIAV
jgi:hypothetical protein